MTNLAMEEKEKFTVTDLIELLSSLEGDREVLIESSESDLFCIIDIAPKKKHRGRPRKLISFEDVIRQRRKNYEKYYGSTAFKYGYRRWTKQEDELIMKHPEENDLILSKEMNRSVASIHTRRCKLRKEDMPETKKPKKRSRK